MELEVATEVTLESGPKITLWTQPTQKADSEHQKTIMFTRSDLVCTHFAKKTNFSQFRSTFSRSDQNKPTGFTFD